MTVGVQGDPQGAQAEPVPAVTGLRSAITATDDTQPAPVSTESVMQRSALVGVDETTDEGGVANG